MTSWRRACCADVMEFGTYTYRAYYLVVHFISNYDDTNLNLMLKEQCRTNGFIFVENMNIVLSDHIGHDGVHLNKAGSSVLCSNLCNSLNFLNSKP